ncbi:MAG: metallophosphoesterase [Phycisphaerae bacterium]
MPNAVADIFRQAATLNTQDGRRRGNVVDLEGGCDVVVTGDVHGNRQALTKILSYFDRPSRRPRRLILQELIHGPADEASGHDRSIELLLRAVRLKVERPADVLFVLGNHDLAQITGVEIAKEGCLASCQAFADGARFVFGSEGDEILAAVGEFIVSMPLAVRCPNGVMITHSLPSPRRMKVAGTEILHRPYRLQEDFLRGGAAYEWTWGRGQTDEQVDALAAELGVELFLLGHRHTPSGIEAVTRRAITLTSDSSHACLVAFPADQPLDAQTVLLSATPLAAINLHD